MIAILGLSGSLRERSFNSALLRCAAELLPADARIELTSQGAKLLPVLERAGKVVSTRALRDFTATEQRQLCAFLKRMIRNVQ